jgi:hypothetical protein
MAVVVHVTDENNKNSIETIKIITEYRDME